MSTTNSNNTHSLPQDPGLLFELPRTDVAEGAGEENRPDGVQMELPLYDLDPDEVEVNEFIDYDDCDEDDGDVEDAPLIDPDLISLPALVSYGYLRIEDSLEEGMRFTFEDNNCVMAIEDRLAEYLDRPMRGRYAVFKGIKSFPERGTTKLVTKCLCDHVVSAGTFRKFRDSIKDDGKLARDLYIFTTMTDEHQRFVLELSSVKAEERNTDIPFAPIRDIDELDVAYSVCRESYSPRMRKVIKTLFDTVDNTDMSGTNREDAMTKLTYAIGLNSAPVRRPIRSFDEIMEILDRRVYGMHKFKERIAEHIIASYQSDSEYMAFLLVGKPGVGKTSVCAAVAEIFGLPMANVDCAGVDAVSLCGVSSTYNGAQPSKISKALLGCRGANVLLRLDEIDKIVSNHNGNGFDALIKPLGPEHCFYDEFLGFDIDMSHTVIACTTNDISGIPEYIINRFGDSIFYLPEYNEEDKVQIARRFSWPKMLAKYRLTDADIRITDDALRCIAGEYCSDSGARLMESAVESVIRKCLRIRSVTGKMPRSVDRRFVRENLSEVFEQRRKVGF